MCCGGFGRASSVQACGKGYPLEGFIEHPLAYPIDNDLNQENQEEPHRCWANVTGEHVERSLQGLQSPNEIHSARDVRLQFFHNRKMQRKMFLSTTANDVQYLPAISAFQIHKALYLLTEIRLLIYRYIETRCVAARLYAFEDNSEYTDIYGTFCTYD